MLCSCWDGSHPRWNETNKHHSLVPSLVPRTVDLWFWLTVSESMEQMRRRRDSCGRGATSILGTLRWSCGCGSGCTDWVKPQNNTTFRTQTRPKPAPRTEQVFRCCWFVLHLTCMNASGPPLSPSAHPADCECSICQLRASCRPVATTSRTRSTGSTGNLVGQHRRNLQAQQVHHSHFKERHSHLTPTLCPRNRSCASRSGTNNGGRRLHMIAST